MYFKNKVISTTNWLGLWTLCSKETQRFLKVYYQTILAPIVTNILFFTITHPKGPPSSFKLIIDNSIALNIKFFDILCIYLF